MQHTTLGVVLVASLKVVLRVDGHIRRGNINILIVRDVDTCRVVHLIIGTCSDGEARHCAFAMIEDGIHIGGEHTLILVVHLNGRVGPPKERLGQAGTIAHPPLNLQISTAGSECEARHSFLMEHALHLVHPYRYGTVFILHDGGVDRQIGRGTMVLGPVKLDATRDPRSCQTNEGGFDDVIIIHKVALLNLVVGHLDTSAQFGQDHHFDILVFDIDSLPLLIHLLIRDRLYDRVGVYHTT